MDDFTKFIDELKSRVGMRETTDIYDHKGVRIKTGNIILFAQGTGGTLRRCDESVPEGQRCYDVAQRLEGGLYAINYDTCTGAFLWKVDGECEVIGDVFTNPEPLRKLKRFSPNLAERLAYHIYHRSRNDV